MSTYDVYKFERVQIGVVACEPKDLFATLLKKGYYYPAATSQHGLLYGDVDTGNYILSDGDTEPNTPLLMIDKTIALDKTFNGRTTYVVHRLDKVLVGKVTCEPADQKRVLLDAGHLPAHFEVVTTHGAYGAGNYLICDPATRPETPLLLLKDAWILEST